VGNVVLLFGILTVLFFESAIIGYVMAGCTALMPGMVYRMRKIAVPYNMQMFQSYSELFGFIGERLSGKEDVRAMGAVAYVLRQLYRLLRKVYHTNLKSGYISLLIPYAMMFSFQIIHAVILGIGVYLFLKEAITLGTVFMFIQYIRLLRGPLMIITSQIQQFQQTGASVERVEELFQIGNKITDEGNSELPEGSLGVAFEDVSFSYVEEDPVLKDISFQLNPGETLGLLGRTGSGKTTIARMLFRFYDAQKGAVRIADMPVNECRLKELRSRIGMVTQDVQLFKATVRENLTFFDTSISDDEILDAISSLGLSSWLKAVPEGLDTELGTNAVGLSAGEAQLLAFTRVFLKQPGLIVLDEASSRLDPATEQLLELAMDKLLSKQTAIVIAHRLDTVKRADRIIILDAGEIAETGSRIELEKDPNSAFHRLLQMNLKEAFA